jgi:hypothetical protein
MNERHFSAFSLVWFILSRETKLKANIPKEMNSVSDETRYIFGALPLPPVPVEGIE